VIKGSNPAMAEQSTHVPNLSKISFHWQSFQLKNGNISGSGLTSLGYLGQEDTNRNNA
jgi:hypothetical protein